MEAYYIEKFLIYSYGNERYHRADQIDPLIYGGF